MKKISLTLEDVFSFWRANEAWNPKWQTVAKEKGFDSWEAWRRKFLDRLVETTTAEWTLEALEDPLAEVPKWYGGPFSGWIKNVYGGKPTMSFSEIVKQPFINGHDYIPVLLEHFPKLTIISIIEDTTGRIFVVEGMHRTCALTLLAQTGVAHDGIVFIAKGKLKEGTVLSFSVSP